MKRSTIFSATLLLAAYLAVPPALGGKQYVMSMAAAALMIAGVALSCAPWAGPTRFICCKVAKQRARPPYHQPSLEPIRLIAHCRQLTDEDLARPVTILRDTPQSDTRLRLLAHLFQHQIHHRGQVHAMLAGTSVEAPQLDEFFCAGEADLRTQDFLELGWTETQVWGQD